MYNLRYHVASLAAVFLALAVGLVLGTAIADQSGIGKRQQQLVASLQDEFNRLRTSNLSLSRELAAGAVLEKEAASRFGKGLLAGDRVLAIAIGPGVPAGMRDLVARMTDAGASVQTLTIHKAGFGLDDAQLLVKVNDALGTTGLDPHAAAAAVEATLPAELTTAGGGPVLKALIDAGAVGLDPPSVVPPKGVVLVYSGGPDAGIADLVALGRRFEGLKVDVVGVERTDADPSSVATFQDAAIATVDDVDRPLGQLSTVLVLAGSGRGGHYGSKESATAAMPPLVTAGGRR